MSRKLTPSNFAKAWKRPLQKIEFSQWPVLPNETTSFLYYAGLPTSFVCGHTSFRFVAVPSRLSEIWSKSMDARWAFPFDWNRYWYLGDFEYTQACAWICIEEITGHIVKVD